MQAISCFYWTSAIFSSVDMATKEKLSFATETNMSLSKIPFNFKQLRFVDIESDTVSKIIIKLLMIDYYSFGVHK